MHQFPPRSSVKRALKMLAYGVGLAEHPDKVPVARSPKWDKVRDQFLLGKTCSVCGRVKNLNAHHKKPFHKFPELELDSSNLIALCETGPGSTNCHCLVGHCGDWKAYNPNVDEDAVALRTILGHRLR